MFISSLSLVFISFIAWGKKLTKVHIETIPSKTFTNITKLVYNTFSYI